MNVGVCSGLSTETERGRKAVPKTDGDLSDLMRGIYITGSLTTTDVNIDGPRAGESSGALVR